jgi:hypothetical protein
MNKGSDKEEGGRMHEEKYVTMGSRFEANRSWCFSSHVHDCLKKTGTCVWRYILQVSRR